MNEKILVTGASGYIGSHLVPELLDRRYRVRAMVRQAHALVGHPWAQEVEVVQTDIADSDSLRAALTGVSVVYYLIHSMTSGKDFAQKDLEIAKTFAKVARETSVERIIYLGALGEHHAHLSGHLKSRQDVGKILTKSGVTVIEFRSAVIVGSGSLSFEMIRHLTERLPLMICPKWIFTKIQPISIHDVLSYLVAALDLEDRRNRIIEIGGQDILSYKDLMLIYAKQRNLKRFIIRVPVLTPRLSSYWVHLVTPIPSSMAIPLIEGVKNEVVVKNHDADILFKNIIPQSYASSVAEALESLRPCKLIPYQERGQREFAPTTYRCLQKEGMIIEQLQNETSMAPERVFRKIEAIGGKHKWWGLEYLWFLRGWADRMVGGEGFVAVRPNRNTLEIGDQVDFLNVEQISRPEELLFKVRFKLPGKGWLRFNLLKINSEKMLVCLHVYFSPHGLWGVVYWYMLLPFHRLVFRYLLKKIVSGS